MTDLEKLHAALQSAPQPDCTKLTPFRLVSADAQAGAVTVEFDPQPAFRNHFGNIQGGFAAAMLDVPISLAVFAATSQWMPTLELKCSFLSPLPIGPCFGEGRVLRAGRSIVFVEGRLVRPDGAVAVHATATVAAQAR
jgi:uncharacterized protein (TIGR00369 family)